MRHDKWLSMMYPRLALLRVLLAESGGLFLTLDDHEAHRARVLMDELFGAENFLANITWEKTRHPEDTGSPFLETHTHVIAYARNAEIWCPNPSAVKVPTIWNAAEVGAARKAQTVAHSHPAALYPLIPKPVGLLRRILRIAAGPDALVLDPFAGSGTTAQAVLEQNASDRATGSSCSSRPIAAPGPSSLGVSRRRPAGRPIIPSTPSRRTRRSSLSVAGPRPGADIPAAAALLAFLFIKEQMPRARLFGIALSVLGVLLVGGMVPSGGGSATLLGNALMVVAVLAYGAYAVQGRALRTGGGHPASVATAAGFAAGLLFLLPPAAGEALFFDAPDLDPKGWLALAYLGIVASGLTMFLWNYAPRHVPASAATLYVI